jgi:hypothetical protein
VCTWSNRFDDPNHEFRTLYCSRDAVTAIREALQDLRTDTRALAEFRRLLGGSGADRVSSPRRAVSLPWRQEHVLVAARIEAAGPLVDLEDLGLRRELELELAPTLAEAGVRHLDIADLRGRQRAITQRLARHLFTTRAAAGVAFRSHLDNRPCAALFEGRGRLVATGTSIPLTEPIRELHQVCEEFGLDLEGSLPEPKRSSSLSLE